jgi:predicted short-subunit dehydrogenase-like oxidoreductase (DUF2520 family)
MNRRVPNKKIKRYTIVGDGKMSLHLCHYFSLLGINYNCWSRKQSINQLKAQIKNTDLVILLISDNAIEQFVRDNSFINKNILVHFSGVLSSHNIIGCHPLMTFSNDLYDIKTYQDIPFVCDEGIDFYELFPKLSNQFFSINQADKAYYHAMCVMAGNFTQILMKETAAELTSKMHLPDNILFPYLLRNTLNFIKNPNNSSTGPIQRGDFTTINKHLQVLKNCPMEVLYKCFVNYANNHKFVCDYQSSSIIKEQVQ